MISPGWQSSSRQIASSVEKRMALAFPFLRIERLAGVMSTRSASSPSDILRLAIITSMFMIIAIKSSPPPFIVCISLMSSVLDGQFLLLAQILADGEDLGGEKDQDTHDDHCVGDVETRVDGVSASGEQFGHLR